MSETDAGLDTVVAGLRCRDVLDDLSEFLDGAISPERVRLIQGHLAHCDRCARFGGEIANTLAALRTSLGTPTPIDGAQSARLRDALRRAQSA
ncbi:MAG: zf-HC2 domain-containing protein [Gemmatimonadaceae bacterium]|jgi:anti-sigma factor RsiW|nr:zf-HC2 domain-containing protein [Gemmatimonadaceae bacterium]MCC6429729.1 zf-HC2 domain-containing protein [Gemmatimonadaceae bacterium]